MKILFKPFKNYIRDTKRLTHVTGMLLSNTRAAFPEDSRSYDSLVDSN